DKFWDYLITSGDMVTHYLKQDVNREIPIFHWGPDADTGIYDGTQAIRSDLNEAEVLVCTGLFDSDYEITPAEIQRLQYAIDRQVPFLCANPDRAVKVGKESMICAGALADLYG